MTEAKLISSPKVVTNFEKKDTSKSDPYYNLVILYLVDLDLQHTPLPSRTKYLVRIPLFVLQLIFPCTVLIT